MSNRIEKAFDALKAENKKAFITYVTAGLPTMKATKEIIKAQVGYTDVIELGIPFSDPIADGPVIQQASYEAIQGGANITGAFRLMKELRSEGVNIPIVFMLYYNTVFNMGEEQFINKCRECGVDGLIIPDLPYEEQDGIRAAIGDDDTTIQIQLIISVLHAFNLIVALLIRLADQLKRSSGASKNCTAFCQNTGKVLPCKHTEITIYQSSVAVVETIDFNLFVAVG